VETTAVCTERSSVDAAVAVEHAGDASARVGSVGTAVPVALASALTTGVAAGVARPDEQPTQAITQTARTTAERDATAQRPTR
jgi:hypothetical protein